PDRPRTARPGGSTAGPGGPDPGSAAVPEPGAVAARLRRTRARHGRGRVAAAARAGALPGDPGRERRPVLPGPGRRPEGAGARGSPPNIAGWHEHRRTVARHSPAGRKPPPA